ncbi:hypothetical protein SKAU_G00212220 [Synaphobranchus kaupii]|uniref:HTH psq-type domain-containing protein n=1 Tax=Synaphobranchus kaupii TaxID=118154 RepID=A0A9Q1IT12_SYNKA|nr:hypothetical protein SKAU_G00212220 [Synaphobranchus kaupii]
MLRSVEACKEGMSVRQAVRLYKVPQSTLVDRVNRRVTHGAGRGRDPNAKPLSRTWWRNFRQHHHVDLTMRTPEIIDRGRAVCAREQHIAP